MNTYNLKSLISLTILTKIFLLVVVAVGFYFLPFNKYQHDHNFLYHNNERITLHSAFKTWDAQHYIFLAEKGYSKESPPSLAFYPLYPTLIKLLKPIFFNNSWFCGIALSNVFCLIAIIVFYIFVQKLFSSKTAFISSVFLLSFPTAFYLSLIYAESLFIMLIMVFFFCLYEGRILPAFIAALLLPLTKIQGLLMVVPLGVFILNGLIKKEGKKHNLLAEIALICAFIAGCMTYLLFMKYSTGSYWTGFEAQKFYKANNSLGHICNLHDWFIRNFIHIKFVFHGYTTSILDRLFFIAFVLLLVPAYRRLDKTLFSYALVMCLIPALMDSFMSYSRYIFLCFPIYIALAQILKEKYYYLALLMFATQLAFLLAHTLNYWLA